MVIERIQCPILEGKEGIGGALVRYGFLSRLRKSAERRGLAVLAFGLGEREVRFVVEGERGAISNCLRGIKVGTTRVARRGAIRMVWGETLRRPIEEDDLEAAVVWGHRAPVDAGASGPLASPWSSHRDLLWFRVAPFFDATRLDGRVDPRAVHAALAGRPLPEGWPPEPQHRESLSVLLRVAGAVLGVLPADRRCFRLFVHLARAQGWRSQAIARALCLTTRRIRQLSEGGEPLLPVALTTLADPRLRCVP